MKKDYKDMTAGELKRAALSGDANAMKVISNLFNDVFYAYNNDPVYPGGSATDVPKVSLGRIEGKSYDEKMQEQHDDVMYTIRERIFNNSPVE